MDEHCDYCGIELGTYGYMRAVGWSDLDGQRLPLIKAWCGNCTTPDDIDRDANQAIRSNMKRRNQ